MSKTIVISDIHDKIQTVDNLLNFVEHDNVIFTGDYFDSRLPGDKYKLTESTAKWVKEKLSDPRNTLLVGNHDAHYLFPNNSHIKGSGFDDVKSKIINDILGEDFFKLKLFHYESGILFTHAGVTRQLVPYIMDEQKDYTIDEFIQKFEEKSKISIEKMKDDKKSPLFNIGFDRGGRDWFGGILWQDHSQHVPIENIKQIYGHSIRKVPEFAFLNRKHKSGKYTSFRATIELNRGTLDQHILNKPWSLDFDTELNHFIVIDDVLNTISIRKVTTSKMDESITTKEVLSFNIK